MKAEGTGTTKRRDALAVLAGVVLVLGVATFLVVAFLVERGATRAFDEGALRFWRDAEDLADPFGPPAFAETARDLTALGSFPVLCLAILAVAGTLWMERRRAAAMLVLASTTGGLVLSTVLKLAFARPRPEVVPHLMTDITMSFPSGHSLHSATVWLTLGALLTRIATRRRVRAFVLGIAVLVTAMVGVSRVYLGVHYPTDVLAGWSLGASWAALCWLVALRLRGELGSEAAHAGVPPPESD